MLNNIFLKKNIKLFFKLGGYLDYALRKLTKILVSYLFINVFQFFGEKFFLEYYFRFNPFVVQLLYGRGYENNHTSKVNNMFRFFSLFFLIILV